MLLALVLAAACAWWLSADLRSGAPPGPVRAHGSVTQVADLGGAAGALVSRTLGRAQRAYWARPGRGGPITAGALRATFGRSGVDVRSGAVSLGMRLSGYGGAGAMLRLPQVSATAERNRVGYAQGPVEVWYENGPMGLEQGFTVRRAPAAAAAGRLMLALALNGDARAVRAGAGIEFLHGRSSLSYGDLSARDSTGRLLPSRIELRGRRLLLEVDTAGAHYPLSVDPLIQTATLTASAANQQLLSVAISADSRTIVAGAPGSGAGLAFVFTEPAKGGWASASAVAELSASDGAGGDEFGNSVAISPDGGTIVVSAPAHSSGAGAAYLFEEPAGGWVSAQQSTEMTGAAAANFGRSIGVSDAGDTVVVGAPGVSSGTGAAYVYEKGGGWGATATAAATLRASDAASGARFGSGVAISDNGGTIAVGATFANKVGAGDSGAVYVFSSSGGWSGTPTQTAELTPSAGVAPTTGSLGESVALAGDGATVVAGAPQSGSSSDGAVFIFTEPASGGWKSATQAAELDSTTTEQGFGQSVAISDDGGVIVAGMSDSADTHGGVANEYLKPAGGWTTGQSPTARVGPGIGATESYLFGNGVAAADAGGYPILAISVAASGASDTSAGAVDVYAEQAAPAITSADSTSFTVGVAGSFTVTTSGMPVPALSESGALPAGLSFTDNGDGTATISGTPSQAGSFPIEVTASNGVSPAAAQPFTINVAASGGSTSTSTPTSTSPAPTAAHARRRPNTRITRHSVQARRRTATFRFKAVGTGLGRVSFQCALVRLPAKRHHRAPRPRYSKCRSPKRYTHLRAGAHYRFYVRARDSAGIDRSPASFSFRA